MVKSGAKRWAHILPELNREKICLISHPALKSVTAHSHLFFELTYIRSGTVEHTIDGRTSVLQAGDYFLVDYGSIHSYRSLEDRSFSNTDCLFLPEAVDPLLKGEKNLKAVFSHYLVNYNLLLLPQDPTKMIFHDTDGKIWDILNTMTSEINTKDPGYMEMIRCRLVEILLLTIRRMKDASVASGTQKLSSYLTAYVSKHYMEEVSLTALSAKMNYSLPYVSKCFKEETGLSFVQYLQNYRIKQASKLLLSTAKNIPEVAELVGYRDVKFFTKVFKSITGYSPAAFRKQQSLRI